MAKKKVLILNSAMYEVYIGFSGASKSNPQRHVTLDGDRLKTVMADDALSAAKSIELRNGEFISEIKLLGRLD
jgi:hypothetical protein